ncbi:FprA family A-type flavoprotein [Bacteroidales bacterium OttesenSCG-928-C19]|nr:FprA family A-type flavoprotein [Bacteroidales bacterium OttesenSCG-928-C19]
MEALKIKEGIYWVGGIDWDLRNFHGYKTQRGSTYNAYLIIDEKITLIDTTKYYLVDELIERISKIIDPSKIDYIVTNHVEMDHSGGLPRMMELAPNAQIITNQAGEKGVREHYKKDWNFKLVQTGDTVSIGKRTLAFVTTPMVHWPDNMVTYVPEEKILFSNDAFGQHIASSERFDTEYPVDIILEEAKKYYANIVLPYSTQVGKALDETLKLDLEMIAPSHGIIWTGKNIQTILEHYKRWSANETAKKVVIVYDSMWGSTTKMSYAVYRAFERRGYKIKIFDLKLIDISDVMTEVQDAEYICVGSPTLNKGIMPNVAAFLTYLRGLAPKGRKGIIYGSYGWAQQNIKEMQQYFDATDIETVFIKAINYIPTEESLKAFENEVFETVNRK